MARLPNGCSRMLCALLQFGSLVSAVNRPSPPIARTRRSDPAHHLVEALFVGQLVDEVMAGDDHDRRAHHVEPEDRPQLLGEPGQMLHRRAGIEREHVADHGLGRRLRNRTQSVLGRHCRMCFPCLLSCAARMVVIPGRCEAPDPESRDSGLRCFASPRNDGPKRALAKWRSPTRTAFYAIQSAWR